MVPYTTIGVTEAVADDVKALQLELTIERRARVTVSEAVAEAMRLAREARKEVAA